jgi:uncharacterized membrane protein YccC
MYDFSALIAPVILIGVMLLAIGLLYWRYKIATMIILLITPLVVFLLIFARMDAVVWVIVLATVIALLVASLLIGMVKQLEAAEQTRDDQRQLLNVMSRLTRQPGDPPKR